MFFYIFVRYHLKSSENVKDYSKFQQMASNKKNINKMAEYTLPYFGKLLTEKLKEYYDVDIEFNGNKIQIDLNFEDKTIDSSTMNKVKNFIGDIDKFDKLNKIYIRNDYNDEDGDTIKFYLEHHLEEISKDDISILINLNSINNFG